MWRDIFPAMLHLLSGMCEGHITKSTGSTMAIDSGAPNAGNNGHRATYESFMTITKWAIGFVAVTLILLALFLVH